MNLLYWLLPICVGCIIGYFTFKKDKKAQQKHGWIPSLLRGLSAALITLILLNPPLSSFNTEEEKPTIVWLQDVSSSTNTSLSGHKSKFIQERNNLFNKLSKQFNVQTLGFGAGINSKNIDTFQEPLTNISQALQYVSEKYQDKNLGAVILASDGIYNEGSDPNFASFAKPMNIYSVGIGDSTSPKDIVVSNVYTNKTVALNNYFEIFADLKAYGFQHKEASISLIHEGKTIDVQKINLQQANANVSLSFKVKAENKGLQQYRVVVNNLPEEQNTKNNSLATTVNVIEKKTKILLLSQGPHPDMAAIHQSIKQNEQFELNFVTDGKVPNNITDYQMCILYQMDVKLPAELPVWYILGAKNSNPNISQGKNIKATKTGALDAIASLNNGFTTFQLPAPIQSVVPILPPLATSFKLEPQASNDLFIGNTTTSLWQLFPGDKPYAILNGEGIWRWAMYEYKNFKTKTVMEELITKTIQSLQVDKDEKPFKIELLKNNISSGEAAVILAQLKNKNGELVNTPEANIKIVNAQLNTRYNFEKVGNSYRLQLPSLAPGTYELQAHTTFNSQSYQDNSKLFVTDLPIEAYRTHADFETLIHLAQNNNGHFFNQYNFSPLADSLAKNEAIRTIIHETNVSKSLIDLKWIFFVLLALLSAEWIMRKQWSLQ